MNGPTLSDVEKFGSFIKSLPLNYDSRPEEFGYTNPVLVVVDAVLSINRQYQTFVVPRINFIESKHIGSLVELRRIIKQKGSEEFCKFWNYRHPKRVDLLDELTKRFLEIQKKLRD